MASKAKHAFAADSSQQYGEGVSSGVFRFRVGALDCAMLTDGSLALPASRVFVEPPPGAAEVVLPFHALLIRGEGKTILVDTGWNLGGLVPSLAEAGCTPEEVKTVLLSHGHADHTAGAALFPHARVLLNRAEFDYWFTDEAMAADPLRAPLARPVLEALRPRLEWYGEGDQVAPGITAVAAPGHTPHNFVFHIASQEEVLLYAADYLPHPAFLVRPDLALTADVDKAQAAATRQRLFTDAAGERWLVASAHMPAPAVGRLAGIRAGVWAWEPLAVTRSRPLWAAAPR